MEEAVKNERTAWYKARFVCGAILAVSGVYNYPWKKEDSNCWNPSAVVEAAILPSCYWHWISFCINHQKSK